METPDAWLRWTRAAALATVASLVAVWAHVGAGGRLPSAPVLLLVVGALTVGAQPLLTRPASALRVVLLTVGGQAVAHAALSLTAGHRGDPPATPAAPRVGGHEHGTHSSSTHDHVSSWDAVVGAGRGARDAAVHLLDDLASAGTPMLLTHLAAAVLVGAWLAAGERAVWTLVTLAWRTLILFVARALPCLAPQVRATPAAVTPLLRRVTAGSLVRRGPPSLLAA